MDQETIQAVVEEIRPLLLTRRPGKIFQLTPLSLAIDFHLRDSRYLLVSAEPAQPRLHLIERRVRDLEKQSLRPTPFALVLKKELSDTKLTSIEIDQHDRIVYFSFSGQNELSESLTRMLVAQLTGRAANLFLLDENKEIVARLRPGDRVSPTVRQAASLRRPALKKGSDQVSSLSAFLDAHYTALAARAEFDVTASAARARLKKEISRQETLLQKLKQDFDAHADAEEQKRIGDLLLANLSDAKRHGSIVRIVDYFREDAATIEVEVDKNSTLQEEAARRFAAYSRSKRAVGKIQTRIADVKTALADLRAKQDRLEEIIAEGDQSALETFGPRGKQPSRPATKQRREEKIPGVRHYLSSDGYEILVGRASRDNDHLTFKVARPNDLWLHAGDYPGSHVLVRNSSRKEIPQRTIIEAAQLAAHFSQARNDAKVAVHYTPRKFISKPKGAAPGLVRLSRFKTMNVAPGENVERA
jgi:predicted ribosome quality control (RQC) complex YloA/Tae2 family protein